MSEQGSSEEDENIKSIPASQYQINPRPLIKLTPEEWKEYWKFDS